MLPVLRFNFASPHGQARTQGELIRAAIELAQWGESRGIITVSIDEHHATGHGWSCNPILAAGMFLARTSTLIASVDCALGPLWNPVRLAEDIALVDNMSRGRLHTTVGLGYRSVEYDALGMDFSQRGPLMDSLIERMLVGRGRTPVPTPGRTRRCTSAAAPASPRGGRRGFGCRSAWPTTCLTSPITTGSCARGPGWRR